MVACCASEGLKTAIIEKVLGASILSVEGDEIIHGRLDVMYVDNSYKTISQAVHIHPTVLELNTRTLQDLKPLK